jgi:hypothetical protein
MTGEPDPVLSDPKRERLAHPTERPPVEFTRSTRVLVYTAAVLGLVLAFGVFWYVFTEMQ